MRWANREIHFISGPGWEQKGCSFSRGKRAHQIEEAGRDSKQIINSFLSCYNWNQSKPFLWKGAENWISAVADRNDCHSPPNWMSFLKLHRERAGKAGKQRSTYGRYQYAHLPAGVPGTPLRFRSLFLPLLFFCFVGLFSWSSHQTSPFWQIKPTFLVPDVQISVLVFYCSFLLPEWRWFCYNILSSDSSVRKCSGTATPESLSWVFTPACPREGSVGLGGEVVLLFDFKSAAVT